VHRMFLRISSRDRAVTCKGGGGAPQNSFYRTSAYPGRTPIRQGIFALLSCLHSTGAVVGGVSSGFVPPEREQVLARPPMIGSSSRSTSELTALPALLILRRFPARGRGPATRVPTRRGE
jgi:hypothetical protein